MSATSYAVIVRQSKDLDGRTWHHGFVAPIRADGTADPSDAVYSTPDCRDLRAVRSACEAVQAEFQRRATEAA